MYAIAKCLAFFGGAPKILVMDNLKSAVIKTDRYEPTLNKALEDMGNHYHFVTIPCKPYSPTHKGLVENHVKLVYWRVIGFGRTYLNEHLASASKAILERSAEYYENRAARCSLALKQLISDMFLDLEERAYHRSSKYQTCDFMLSPQRN